MAGCLVELHVWSIKAGLGIRDGNIACHAYHDKGDVVTTGYIEPKQQYMESRDVVWTPKNRRPDKLRDLLKEAEELLDGHKVVSTLWRSQKQLQVLLSNCVLLSIQLANHSGDIDRLVIDRTLQGKLVSTVAYAVMTSGFIMCTFNDKPKVAFVYFSKRANPVGDSGKKMDKISALDPKISYVDLPGPKNKQLERRLSVNITQEWILVWWSAAADSAWPWAPMTAEKDRANVIVYAINGSKLEELNFVQTECEPLAVNFSVNQPRHIYTLEVTPGKFSVDTCIYECSPSRIQRAAVTTIPLKARVFAHGWNHNEDKLILGCEDRRLVLYDESKRITQFVQADLLPRFIAWHPADTIFLVGSSEGKIQCYDMALTPLVFYLLSEQLVPRPILALSSQFRFDGYIQGLSWVNPSCSWDSIADAHDSMLITIERGPLVMLQMGLGVLSRGSLGAQQLTNQYLSQNQIEQAVHLLLALNWNTASSTCFACLSALINHLLRLPLNPVREAALEASLGSFYAPVRPLSEVIVVEYRDAVSRLARRFFQLLLRYQRFEKAFLLAVDLHSRDLFMDIHHLAIDKGEMALATVAKQKADDIEQELPSTSGTDEYNSEDSLEDDDGSSYTSEEEGEEGGRSQGIRHDPRQEQRHPERRPRGTRDQPQTSSRPGDSVQISRQVLPPGKSRKTRKDVDRWHRAEERIDEAYRQDDDDDDRQLRGATGLDAIPGEMYTKVLTDNPFGWDTADGASSARPSGRRQEAGNADDQEEVEQESTQTLKVVHFGMV